jgi:hypothetical protein
MKRWEKKYMATTGHLDKHLTQRRSREANKILDIEHCGVVVSTSAFYLRGAKFES